MREYRFKQRKVPQEAQRRIMRQSFETLELPGQILNLGISSSSCDMIALVSSMSAVLRYEKNRHISPNCASETVDQDGTP